MTVGAARAIGLAEGLGTLARGAPADIAVIDVTREGRIEASRFESKGRNTPFDGRVVRGRARFTLVGGRIVHEA
jgi:dihydroorotase